MSGGLPCRQRVCKTLCLVYRPIYSLEDTSAFITGANTANPEITAYELPRWVLVLEFGIIVAIILFDYIMNQLKIIPYVNRKVL